MKIRVLMILVLKQHQCVNVLSLGLSNSMPYFKSSRSPSVSFFETGKMPSKRVKIVRFFLLMQQWRALSCRISFRPLRHHLAWNSWRRSQFHPGHMSFDMLCNFIKSLQSPLVNPAEYSILIGRAGSRGRNGALWLADLNKITKLGFPNMYPKE